MLLVVFGGNGSITSSSRVTNAVKQTSLGRRKRLSERLDKDRKVRGIASPMIISCTVVDAKKDERGVEQRNVSYED